MIAVRTMRQQDVEEVAALEREIFSQPWSAAGFLDALKLDNTVFLAAEEHGRIVGYVGMYRDFIQSRGRQLCAGQDGGVGRFRPA